MTARHAQLVLPINPRSTFVYPVEPVDDGTEETS